MKPERHPDIILLQRRLNYLVELEEYEIAAKIKKWIDELSLHYENKLDYDNTKICICSNEPRS